MSTDLRQWQPNDVPAVSVREMVLNHDRDIDDLKAWRNELRGAMQLVKITLGTSLVSGALAVLAIIGLVMGAMR